jgi:hypothetical protein
VPLWRRKKPVLVDDLPKFYLEGPYETESEPLILRGHYSPIEATVPFQRLLAGNG